MLAAGSCDVGNTSDEDEEVMSYCLASAPHGLRVGGVGGASCDGGRAARHSGGRFDVDSSFDTDSSFGGADGADRCRVTDTVSYYPATQPHRLDVLGSLV